MYYKKLGRLKKETEETPMGYSASTAFLSNCNNLKIVPSPVGLMSHKAPKNVITARYRKLGKAYGMAIS
jgi:hypothetical protein